MTSNRDLEDLKKSEEARNSPIANFFKTLNATAMIGFVGLIIVGIYVISRTNINPYFFIGILAVLVIIMILRKGNPQRKAIPLPQIRLLALTVMERSVGVVYPMGTVIKVGEFGRMRWEGYWGDFFRPWKWELGMIVIYPNGLIKEVRIIMDPFDGFCTGILPEPSGYRGDKSNDLVVLPTNVIEPRDKNVQKNESK